MLVVTGLYRFKQRREAYRQDFCLSCSRERVAVRTRSFHAGHLYWIPLLPLGFRREWWCTTCGGDPAARPGTSRALVLVFGALLLAVFAMLVMVLVEDPAARVEPVFWGVTAFFALATAGTFYGASRMNAVDRRAHLARLQPTSESTCAFCSATLGTRQAGGVFVKHCARCALDRAG